MKAPNRVVVAALLGVVLLAAVTAFASAKSTKKSAAGVSGSVSIVGVWTGPEEKSFNAVLAGFKKLNPNVKVSYKSTGDNTPTVLATAVAGGNPPDLASVSQPGLVSDFQKKGALKNVDYAKSALSKNYPADIAKLGVIKGHVYGFLIKGANKSTVWYNVKSFKNAGVTAPKTWGALTKGAGTLKASGTPAFSVGGADGWTLTDLFENIYLRQAGPAKYDALSKHTIKWTDASVVKALKTMGTILQSGNIAGGTAGALQTDFPTSVSNVFAASPKAAMVIEGDFVPGVVAGKNPLKPVSGYNVFPFPAIGNTANYVEGGGDMLMAFKDSPAIRALVQYLATGAAQTIWAKRGGYTAPAKTVSPSAYPDAITRTTASAVGKAKVFRFDLSDLQPASFGGTVGQGEFKIFQDFLQNPSNATGIAKSLETAAAKAYKAGK
ncbi:MAG: alpha-glucoside transport system substrate-binding protein [Gaiellaceae bacterium]|nr:alpha-glucoside transport system substrate-binding protein [Gaiellaceae bacterium]